MNFFLLSDLNGYLEEQMIKKRITMVVFCRVSWFLLAIWNYMEFARKGHCRAEQFGMSGRVDTAATGEAA